MAQNKQKSTLKILDYLQQNIPSEEQMTKERSRRKPRTAQGQSSMLEGEMDKDFLDSVKPKKPENEFDPTTSIPINMGYEDGTEPVSSLDKKKRKSFSSSIA